MVTRQDPQYVLVDGAGNPIGSVFSDGTDVYIQHESSGEEIVLSSGGADIQQFSAGDVTIESRIVIYESGGNLLTTLDPASTSTPIQDAIDQLGREATGTIVLPVDPVYSPGDIVGAKNKSFLGTGGFGGSELICNADTDLFIQSNNFDRDLGESYFDNIRFRGNEFDPGALLTRTQGSAFAFTSTRGGANPGEGKAAHFDLGRCSFTNWTGSDPIIDSTRTADGGFFTSTWENVNFGAWEGGLVHMSTGAVGINIGTMRTHNDPADGVSDVAFFCDNNGEIRIQNYISNQHSGTEFQFHANNLRVHIDTFHFETDQELETPGGTVGAPIIDVQGTELIVDNPSCNGRGGLGEAEAFVQFSFNPETLVMPEPILRGGFVFTNAAVDIDSGPTQRVRLHRMPRSAVAINYFEGGTNSGNSGLVSDTDGLLADPIGDTKSGTVPAGGSLTVSFQDLDDPSRQVITEDFYLVSATRATANDYALSLDKAWFDESAGFWKLDISESEGSTAVDVEVEHQPYR